MKLLICTQIVDEKDSNLGFFCDWIQEFAKHLEEVTVICLKKGMYTLPPNVRVLSLGKEEGKAKIVQILRFYRYLYTYNKNYDSVFVHMNPEYVLAGGFWWKKLHRPVVLWYAHKSVTRRLRFALTYLTYVFSVSAGSFKIPTPKLVPVGHGIDTSLFKTGMREFNTRVRLITVGRIAASKRIEEMLNVLDILYARGESFVFTIVGEPGTSEETTYAKHLESEIAKRPYCAQIEMRGPMDHAALPALLGQQDIFLNFSLTGNMDKAGLEALLCGVPLVATNQAFEALLSPYGLYVSSGKAEDVADSIINFLRRSDQSGALAQLRNKVQDEHALVTLVPRMLALMQKNGTNI